MMSTGHALSGAAAGYLASLLFEISTGIQLHWVVPHAAAVVTAGWALWPDCDSIKATVTTSLGLLTRWLHKLVVYLCEEIYWATATEYDDNTPTIHRGATHTWPGALVMGVLIAAICVAFPRFGTPVVLGISLHWAMRGLYMPTAIDKPVSDYRLRGRGFFGRLGVLVYHWWGQKLKHIATDAIRALPLPGKYLRAMGRTSTLAVCMLTAFYMTESTRALDTPWAAGLGALVVLGILTHMVGDSVTESGICWLFPFAHPVTGRRWEPIQLPKWLAFKTGHAFEVGIMYPLCILACIVAMPGGFVLVMSIYAAWRDHRAISAALPFLTWQPKTKPITPTPPRRCVAGGPARRPPQPSRPPRSRTRPQGPSRPHRAPSGLRATRRHHRTP